MPKTDQDTKQKRVELVYLLLERHPNGLTEQEIADMLNMERRTVNNYLRELEIQGKLYKEGRLWFVLPYQRTRLCHFELSPEEAMTLYLATRLLVKQHDKRNESAETALVKLAEVLTGDVGVGHEIHQATLELAQRPGDESYSRVFRTIMQSYIYRRKVSITYYPMNSDPFQTVLSPYLLEPSAIGYATYVIGHSSIVNALRTYKLERIQQATLTREEYTVPPDFPGLDYLRSAWSIISGDELIKVKLRFDSRVARRVRESRWHPSQDVTDDPDTPGRCIWTAQIADLTDFLPWVRGWGSDVTVLGPPELRDKLVKEAQHLATLYQVSGVSETPAHFLLWGKADRKTGEIHRLIYHLIDVGQVALALWRTGLNKDVRQRLAGWLGLNVDEAGQLIAFWSGLHDLGKASPAFQDHPYMCRSLKREIMHELQTAGLHPPNRGADRHADHEVISTWAMDSTYEDLLAAETELPPEWAKKIAQVLGGHHGAWPGPDSFGSAKLKRPDDIGGPKWTAVRRELIRELKSIFQPPSLNIRVVDQTEDNIMLTLLSAIVSAADWLGSDERYFGHEDQPIATYTYARYSKRLAECALLRAGWAGSPSISQPFDFQAAFDFDANDVQKEAITTVSNLALPALVIIEAPTGSGKTEAALSIYSVWARAANQHGLYVAMPTTATSNQMHGRTERFLKTQYGETATTLLIHSRAALRDEAFGGKTGQVEERDREGDRVAALTWFLPRKKSLLAPFGVGTVDQALMSVLQTKHFFVRLLGLSHKVVIFDEVHAYDTYMNTLFHRLLKWLRATGTSVIVLSATLPDETRRELVKAYTDQGGKLLQAQYPRLTYADATGDMNVIKLPRPPEKTLALEWMPRDPAEIVCRLQDELREGGCATVICNTVGRAQELYQALDKDEVRQSLELCGGDNLILFHARYPLAWRDETEQKVLRKFDKDRSKRPDKAIVVATQVIEQSLDLDFDVMISDLAPVDLLLQRAGRLHRHKEDAQSETIVRSHPYRLLITRPDESGPVPKFDRGDRAVYEPYVLLRSWAVLRRKERISLPDDTTKLIEAVYGDSTLPDVGLEMQVELKEAKQRMENDQTSERYKARRRMVPQPADEELLWSDNLALEEDNPIVHQTFRALTRSDRPGLSVVCLHQIGDRLTLEPDSTSLELDVDASLNHEIIRQLARQAVTIRREKVEEYFLAEPTSPVVKKILDRWEKTPALRYHRVAIFTDGFCRLDGTPYTLRLTRKLGLEIRKEGQ